MANDKMNPMAGHLMGMVEGRQQIEVTKLSVMTKIVAVLEDIREELQGLRADVDEVLERTKK